MDSAKLIIKRMCEVAKIANNKDLSDFLEVSYNTLNTWIKRDSIPMDKISEFVQKRQLSYDWLLTGKGEMLLNEQKQNEKNQECQTLRTIIDARDILEHHISDRELDILQAYRSLPEERQELVWHEIKVEKIRYGIKTKPQDAKTA